jgi:hypothetical protein
MRRCSLLNPSRSLEKMSLPLRISFSYVIHNCRTIYALSDFPLSYLVLLPGNWCWPAPGTVEDLTPVMPTAHYATGLQLYQLQVNRKPVANHWKGIPRHFHTKKETTRNTGRVEPLHSGKGDVWSSGATTLRERWCDVQRWRLSLYGSVIIEWHYHCIHFIFVLLFTGTFLDVAFLIFYISNSKIVH